MARLPAWKVALWGGVSACLWNAILLGAGWLLGDNYERLRSLVETYSYTAIAVVVLALLVAVWRWRRGSSARPPEDGDEEERAQPTEE
jgi:membrane protein DedA with SNARE-associated domain